MEIEAYPTEGLQLEEVVAQVALTRQEKLP